MHRYRRVYIPTPAMARVLGLGGVLEGTAQRSGDRIHVSMRLTDVHSGKLIWAGVFDGPAADPVVTQETISHAASAEIGRRISH